MPEPTRATSVRWPVPIALAVPAIAASVFIAFTPGHNVWFGYAVFAGFALLTAAACAIGIGLLPPGAARLASGVKTLVAAVGAIVALLLLAFTSVSPAVLDPAAESPLAVAARGLSIVMAATFALLAVVDLVTGIRARATDRFARDWISVGVIEALGAVAVLVVPPTFHQAFSFTERTGEVISGAVTASTMIVGLFGAVAAILGVLLVIAGIGLVPQRARRERATA